MAKDSHKALLAQLKNPFDPKFVKWRVGATNKDKTKGIALAYLDAREVEKRLDDVMGLAGWKKKLTGIDGGFTCDVLLRIDDEWIGKENAASHTHVEPIKGGASDAFKRAAADWGVGRYLYYLPNIWVPIVAQGKSYTLAEIPELPNWAKPGKVESWEDIAELEADSSSGYDDQASVTSVIDNYNKIRGAESVLALGEIVEQLTTEEQMGLATHIDQKTKELLNGQPKTDSSSS